MKQTNDTLTPVQAKVISANLLKEYALKFLEYEYAHFSQFIGHEVFKVDGSVKKKYAHEKLSFDGTLEDGTGYSANYYISTRGHSLNIKISTCVWFANDRVPNSNYRHISEELTLTVLNMENGALVATEIETEYLKHRYDAAEIETLAKEAKEAGRKYVEAYGKVPYAFRDIFYLKHLNT